MSFRSHKFEVGAYCTRGAINRSRRYMPDM